MNSQLSEILQLSVPERIQLVEDIWDSVAAFPEAVPLTEAQQQELDRRLERYAQNPDDGISWDELKDELRKSE
ncbi:MAG: addiction module protein [Acidobacteria bacterium]|nr:addiction module protein [Acidobacteriota bacterium]